MTMTANRRETHVSGAPWLSPKPVLLGDRAQILTADAGPCGLCSWPLRHGERAARMLTGTWAHLPCLARAVPSRTGR